jgi:hypothetical protein
MGGPRSLRLAQLALRLQLALARQGGLKIGVAALLALAGAGWLGAVPRLERASADREAALKASRMRMSDADAKRAEPELPLAERRLHAFHAALGDVRHVEQPLRTMFAAADQHDMALDQSEYKMAWDVHGRFYTYTVQLPVTGPYAVVRNFSEQVLLALPYASLDEIDFKRKDIVDHDLSARLRFTLHLDGPPGMAGPANDIGVRKAGTP